MNPYEKRAIWVRDYFKKVKLEPKLIKYYKGKNILVTGGAGAIGSNLIIALSDLVGESGKVVVLEMKSI
jgi:FlaA1/EpsC-like NDP-sugar epimerase